jgi:hypothetical protein
MTNGPDGLIEGVCKAVGCQASKQGRLEPLQSSVTKVKCVMKRMMEAIADIVRDPNHPFRKMEHQPKKTLKNRYERRKVKEYLHLTDWQEEAV